MKDLLGGKGAGLAEMSSIGIPVPPGFTITTEVCTEYYAAGKRAARRARAGDARRAARRWRRSPARASATPRIPLLVSVRSGARVSMPGMMDTVLNLGLNDETVEGLAARSGNQRFAWDSYRRFCAMFGDVVLGHEARAARRTAIPSRRSSRRRSSARGVTLRLRAAGGGAPRAGGRVQGGDPRAVRQLDLPVEPARAAVDGRRRRLPLLGQRPGRRLPQAERHPVRPGAPRSASSRWSSATWARAPAPAWPSPATRPPARTSSTASSW